MGYRFRQGISIILSPYLSSGGFDMIYAKSKICSFFQDSTSETYDCKETVMGINKNKRKHLSIVSDQRIYQVVSRPKTNIFRRPEQFYGILGVFVLFYQTKNERCISPIVHLFAPAGFGIDPAPAALVNTTRLGI